MTTPMPEILLKAMHREGAYRPPFRWFVGDRARAMADALRWVVVESARRNAPICECTETTKCYVCDAAIKCDVIADVMENQEARDG